MKKILLLFISVLSLRSAYALPVGNPAAASLLPTGVFFDGCDFEDPCCNWDHSFNFRFGFYGDYVFNRHLCTKDNREIQHTHLFTNAGYLALNFLDRIDIFTSLGVTNLGLETDATVFTATFPSRVLVDYNSRFSWSFGIRSTLYEWCNTTLGIEAQYFSFNPYINSIVVSDIFTANPSDFLTSYREWQVGLGLSQQVGVFIPYTAVKLSHVNLSHNDEVVNFLIRSMPPHISDPHIYTLIFENLKNNKRWGWVVGVTLLTCDSIDLTVEGRFGDEKAVYVDGQIRF